jgi:hypothetical protein
MAVALLSYQCMFQVEICSQQFEICKSVYMFIVLVFTQNWCNITLNFYFKQFMMIMHILREKKTHLNLLNSNFNCNYMAMSSLTYILGFSVRFFQPEPS